MLNSSNLETFLIVLQYLSSGPAYTIERMKEFDPTMPILSTM